MSTANHEHPFGIFEDCLEGQKYLMTYHEAIFFKNLLQYATKNGYIVCPKVRVSDVITIESMRWYRRWNFIGRPWIVSAKLDRLHIDFLLIKEKGLTTVCAIELDDKTHDSEKRKYADNIKTKAFEYAGIRLIRFTKSNASEKEFERLGI